MYGVRRRQLRPGDVQHGHIFIRGNLSLHEQYSTAARSKKQQRRVGGVAGVPSRRTTSGESDSKWTESGYQQDPVFQRTRSIHLAALDVSALSSSLPLMPSLPVLPHPVDVCRRRPLGHLSESRCPRPLPVHLHCVDVRDEKVRRTYQPEFQRHPHSPRDLHPRCPSRRTLARAAWASRSRRRSPRLGS